MSAMQWKNLSVDALRPAAYNPRKKLKVGIKEYEKIKNSILEFGYVEPIIVNYDMTVIGGHQRLTVLKDLGYTEVQCVEVHIEDEKQGQGSQHRPITKSRCAWNEQLLADLIVDLQAANFNTDFTGFEAPEIEQLFSKVHNKDIKEDDFDVEAELQKRPLSRLGMCGFWADTAWCAATLLCRKPTPS
jgi:site-specific DNA-methyltransferase (adenine-specific)